MRPASTVEYINTISRYRVLHFWIVFLLLEVELIS